MGAESSREFPDLLLLSTTTSLLHVSAFSTAETHASSLIFPSCLFAILPSEIPLPLSTTTFGRHDRTRRTKTQVCLRAIRDIDIEC